MVRFLKNIAHVLNERRHKPEDLAHGAEVHLSRREQTLYPEEITGYSDKLTKLLGGEDAIFVVWEKKIFVLYYGHEGAEWSVGQFPQQQLAKELKEMTEELRIVVALEV